MKNDKPSIDERGRRRRMWITVLLAVIILVPSLYGFAGKFIEFVNVYRGDADGVFAVTPILNYLLASCGFLLLLVWAAANGMFRDIEQPKEQMLANEALLDKRQPS